MQRATTKLHLFTLNVCVKSGLALIKAVKNRGGQKKVQLELKLFEYCIDLNVSQVKSEFLNKVYLYLYNSNYSDLWITSNH